jgi:CPA2 family monovalent cation:H+ antiporter-2
LNAVSESSVQPHVIVCGFGVPGRVVVDLLEPHHISLCIIELNASTVERCADLKECMIQGDARDPAVLESAGISRATLVVIAIPDEIAALEVTKQARKLNSTCRIITRCHYQSKGLEAMARGATEVVVSEMVVAQEMAKMIQPFLGEGK